MPPLRSRVPVGRSTSGVARLDQGTILRDVRPGTEPAAGGPGNPELRAASLSARLVFDPAIRDGSAAGRERARRGELTRAAAAAARGRPFPEQRSRKAAQAATPASRARSAEANRQRASEHVTAVAAEVAHRHGYPDIQALVGAQMAAGASLAAISRAAGLHKDWLSRHLSQLDPALARLARQRSTGRPDVAWPAAVRRLGFDDVASYLRERHHIGHQTVNAIATENRLFRPPGRIRAAPAWAGDRRARGQTARGAAAGRGRRG